MHVAGLEVTGTGRGGASAWQPHLCYRQVRRPRWCGYGWDSDWTFCGSPGADTSSAAAVVTLVGVRASERKPLYLDARMAFAARMPHQADRLYQRCTVQPGSPVPRLCQLGAPALARSRLQPMSAVFQDTTPICTQIFQVLFFYNNQHQTPDSYNGRNVRWANVGYNAEKGA